MSSRQIIKSDLLKLLPDHEESQFPAELIALAETYITQARQLFMNTSEAPAKNFVCTHIACEQLSIKLGLPDLNIKQAPIPPAKYKSLFKRIRTEATFRQVRDSGRSNVDTRRRIARDHAGEICAKLSHVPLANILSVLDQLIGEYTSSDVRALVAAVYLLCLQSVKKTKSVSGTVQGNLLRDLGLGKTDVEQAVAYVRQRSRDTDWFDFSIVKQPDLANHVGGQARKRQRITQVRMMQPAIDFKSVKYQTDFQEWKLDMIGKLDEKIKLLERGLEVQASQITALNTAGHVMAV